MLSDQLQQFQEPLPILNHGHVRLVDVFGDDHRVVEMARNSYGNPEMPGQGKVDEGLIRYLMRNEHMSPFEGPVILLDVKAPIFVLRQWLRHRTASLNELSGRYTTMADEFYTPEQWRAQSVDNKQGSSGLLSREAQEEIAEDTLALREHIQRVYQRRLALGAAKELARIDLPLSQYSRMYWQMDLRNLLHFLHLRQDSHAQWEIREYADRIAKIVQVWMPQTWQAFMDYSVNTHPLSTNQLKVFIALARDQEAPPGNISKTELAAVRSLLQSLTQGN